MEMPCQRWSQHEERTDDISVIVGRIDIRSRKSVFDSWKKAFESPLGACTSKKGVQVLIKAEV